MTFQTIFNLGVTEILRSFRFVVEGKTGKKIPEPSRLRVLEKFVANNFALYDAEDNNSGPLKKGGIANLLLLRTLGLKHQEPSLWEVIDSSILLAYSSLADSRTLLQELLACLNSTLESEDIFCWYKQRKLF